MSDETKEMKMFEVTLCNDATFNVKAKEVYYDTIERPTEPVMLFRNSYNDVQAAVRVSDMICWRVL